jgi:hypothetical protein
MNGSKRTEKEREVGGLREELEGDERVTAIVVHLLAALPAVRWWWSRSKREEFGSASSTSPH